MSRPEERKDWGAAREDRYHPHPDHRHARRYHHSPTPPPPVRSMHFDFDMRKPPFRAAPPPSQSPKTPARGREGERRSPPSPRFATRRIGDSKADMWVSPCATDEQNTAMFLFCYKIEACPLRRSCPRKITCPRYHHEGERRRPLLPTGVELTDDLKKALVLGTVTTVREPDEDASAIGDGAEDTSKPKAVLLAYSSEPCLQVKLVGRWQPASLCRNGDACRYAHCLLEQMYHPNIYKTSACDHFAEGRRNNCRFGYYCTHAHGSSQLRFAETLSHKPCESDDGGVEDMIQSPVMHLPPMRAPVPMAAMPRERARRRTLEHPLTLTRTSSAASSIGGIPQTGLPPKASLSTLMPQRSTSGGFGLPTMAGAPVCYPPGTTAAMIHATAAATRQMSGSQMVGHLPLSVSMPSAMPSAIPTHVSRVMTTPMSMTTPSAISPSLSSYTMGTSPMGAYATGYIGPHPHLTPSLTSAADFGNTSIGSSLSALGTGGGYATMHGSMISPSLVAAPTMMSVPLGATAMGGMSVPMASMAFGSPPMAAAMDMSMYTPHTVYPFGGGGMATMTPTAGAMLAQAQSQAQHRIAMRESATQMLALNEAAIAERLRQLQIKKEQFAAAAKSGAAVAAAKLGATGTGVAVAPGHWDPRVEVRRL